MGSADGDVDARRVGGSAQTLVGNWGPINHEDAAERGAGPALVDYSGMPLTEAGRQRGLTWDAAS